MKQDGWYYLAQDSAEPIGPFPTQAKAQRASVGWKLFAFDKSVRSYDIDKRLHVSVANISKANVCGYMGSEIPDCEELGLDPNKMYQLFRSPDELEKAVPTANNLQVLMDHVPVDADDHKPDLTVGSTGTDALFDGTYLKNSLVVWASEGIEGIESGDQKELSSAYRYRADMTPGEFKGTPYDGVMRDIVFNHVALVKEGRAGADVVVGDSALNKEIIMTKVVLSRKAVQVQGALTGYLLPKMAADAKYDPTEILKKLTAKNFATVRPLLAADVKKNVKLAKDMSLDDFENFMDRLEKAEVAEGADANPETGEPMSKDEMEKKADEDAKAAKDKKASDAAEFLKGKLSAEDMATYDSMCGGPAADEFPPAEKKEEKKEGEDANPEKDEKVDKKAMDSALKAVEVNTEKRVMARMQGIAEAREAVSPRVGKIAIACDSAEAVYRAALSTMGVKVEGVDTLPLSALKAIYNSQPEPNARKTPLASDSKYAAPSSEYATRFPGADRIAI